MKTKFEELKIPAREIDRAGKRIADAVDSIGGYFVDNGSSADDAALAVNSILYSLLCINFGYRILAEPEKFEQYFCETFRRNVRSLRDFSDTCDCKKHECSGCLNDQGDVKNLE